MDHRTARVRADSQERRERAAALMLLYLPLARLAWHIGPRTKTRSINARPRTPGRRSIRRTPIRIRCKASPEANLAREMPRECPAKPAELGPVTGQKPDGGGRTAMERFDYDLARDAGDG